MPTDPSRPSRRELLAAATALGMGGATFQRAVAAVALQQPKGMAITPEMVANAEWVAGITLTDDQRKTVAARLTSTQNQIRAVRKLDIGYDIPPALRFSPTPGELPAHEPRGTVTPSVKEIARPANDADLAFLTVAEQAALIRAKKLSSTELTKVSLARLKKYDPALLCVVSLTEELALKQAAAADKEIAAGKYRGALHGIPWVAKDLIAYPGYKTTWGAGHFKEQSIDAKATAAARLDDAGAVLVAKTTLGALAMGDQWFGGMTRNPWNIKQGSSGSSAGTAQRRCRGACPLRHRLGNSRQHRLAQHALRRHRPAPDLRPHQPRRLHDALLVARQARPHGPLGRGLRPRPRRHPRRGPV